ncbi:MAG: GSCFA domain-containing protein [Saprospiraceae bacterium]|nr:GSCFA domain-containing protein [Saprospiraceae bacterium]
MREFRTPIKEIVPNHSIHYQDPIIAAGSCFAENIGQKLSEHKFDVLVNPFGIIYHPLPLISMLERLIDEAYFNATDLFKNNGLWHSWMHHGSFSHPDEIIMLEGLNAAISHGYQQLKKATTLMLTFGTSNGFYLRETGEVVANCHKMPGQLFEKKRTDLEHLRTRIAAGIEKLLSFNKNIQIIITVSPVRHLRDGLITNNRSKAGLLLLAEHLESEFEQVHYFPAYELQIDDLRDYRFFAEDMTHPSDVAIDYIWEAFQNAYFDPSTLDYTKASEKLLKSIQHKPLFPGTASADQFEQKLQTELQLFEEKWGVHLRS